MFRLLVKRSCNSRNTFTYDLRKIVEQATAMDNDPDAVGVHVMKPTGFVFHESRCGSTVVANALAAMEPAEHRVYSESGPPIDAMKSCDSHGKICPPHRAAELLRDVVYLMGRTGDPNERRLFFKIQSLGTKSIDVMTEAFPDTPWIFVYRDPVQIMMSQLKRTFKHANCVQQQRRGELSMETAKFLASIERKVEDLSLVEKCALHLSTLCSIAKQAISRSEGMGIGINYEHLVDKLITDVIPNHFNVSMVEEQRERIIEVSGHYSKDKKHSGAEWKDDSERKEEHASPEIREASKTFLYPSYSALGD